ncbi:hypothetical protein E4U58_001582 [Claviceps cyperi]|nr:hypothetical protein E4U58_001582 [Claviceps cyperi]
MADRYAAKIVSFQYKPQRTIAGNWAKIRLVNSDTEMKSGYNDNVLYRMFVKVLPDVYKPLLDSLKPRPMTVAEKLAYLYEKEGELNPKGDDSDVEEAGHIARYCGGKFRGRGNACSADRKSVQGNHSRRRRDSSASSTASTLTCYLCKDPKRPHTFIDCPDLTTAQMLLEEE